MIVEVEQVSKTYFHGPKPLPVIDNVSFTLAEKEFVCVIGPSGCGKSTLLRLIAGLTELDSGVIRFSGQRRSAGTLTTIVWQDYALIPWRTIKNNVAFGLEVRGVPKHERWRRALANLERVGISAFADHYPYQLSGGMQQRAGIARALTNEPEILLMDEPFGAVDAQTRTILQGELLELWEQDHQSVLFITHSIEEALLLADRVIVMSPRPAAVIEDIVVPFERPRTLEVERAPEFAELRLRLWELLRTAASVSSTRAGA